MTEKRVSDKAEDSSAAVKQALPQFLAVCVESLVLLTFGMSMGFPTILIPSISGNYPNETISLDENGVSWTGSINLIFVPVGCTVSGMITKAIGCKRTMQLINVPFFVAWIIFYFSTQPWHIFAALCLTGASGGLLEAPMMTYIVEIAQPRFRGILCSTSTVICMLGMLFSFLLGSFLTWRNVALVNAAAPVIAFVLLMCVPESPYWLIDKNRLNDARKSLAWLRGWTSLDDVKVEKEFLYICKHLGKSIEQGRDNTVFDGAMNSSSPPHVLAKSAPITKKPSRLDHLKLITKRSFLWPFFLVSYTFLVGHFCGNSSIQVYAIKIFSTLRVPINEYYATILVGTVQLMGTLIYVISISTIGKRAITFISLIGGALSLIVVSSYSYTKGILYFDDPEEELTDSSDTWVPMMSIFFSAFFAYLGVRTLHWNLIGEVFSNETRAIASGLVAGLAYIIGFVANKTFFKLVALLTLPGVFLFYATVSLIGLVSLYFMLPETEGKTLFEISEHFSGRNKLDNKVRRYNEKTDEEFGTTNEMRDFSMNHV